MAKTGDFFVSFNSNAGTWAQGIASEIKPARDAVKELTDQMDAALAASIKLGKAGGGRGGRGGNGLWTPGQGGGPQGGAPSGQTRQQPQARQQPQGRQPQGRQPQPGGPTTSDLRAVLASLNESVNRLAVGVSRNGGDAVDTGRGDTVRHAYDVVSDLTSKIEEQSAGVMAVLYKTVQKMHAIVEKFNKSASQPNLGLTKEAEVRASIATAPTEISKDAFKSLTDAIKKNKQETKEVRRAVDRVAEVLRSGGFNVTLSGGGGGGPVAGGSGTTRRRATKRERSESESASERPRSRRKKRLSNEDIRPQLREQGYTDKQIDASKRASKARRQEQFVRTTSALESELAKLASGNKPDPAAIAGVDGVSSVLSRDTWEMVKSLINKPGSVGKSDYQDRLKRELENKRANKEFGKLTKSDLPRIVKARKEAVAEVGTPDGSLDRDKRRAALEAARKAGVEPAEPRVESRGERPARRKKSKKRATATTAAATETAERSKRATEEELRPYLKEQGYTDEQIDASRREAKARRQEQFVRVKSALEKEVAKGRDFDPDAILGIEGAASVLSKETKQMLQTRRREKEGKAAPRDQRKGGPPVSTRQRVSDKDLKERLERELENKRANKDFGSLTEDDLPDIVKRRQEAAAEVGTSDGKIDYKKRKAAEEALNADKKKAESGKKAAKVEARRAAASENATEETKKEAAETAKEVKSKRKRRTKAEKIAAKAEREKARKGELPPREAERIWSRLMVPSEHLIDPETGLFDASRAGGRPSAANDYLTNTRLKDSLEEYHRQGYTSDLINPETGEVKAKVKRGEMAEEAVRLQQELELAGGATKDRIASASRVRMEPVDKSLKDALGDVISKKTLSKRVEDSFKLMGQNRAGGGDTFLEEFAEGQHGTARGARRKLTTRGPLAVDMVAGQSNTTRIGNAEQMVEDFKEKGQEAALRRAVKLAGEAPDAKTAKGKIARGGIHDVSLYSLAPGNDTVSVAARSGIKSMDNAFRAIDLRIAAIVDQVKAVSASKKRLKKKPGSKNLQLEMIKAESALEEMLTQLEKVGLKRGALGIGVRKSKINPETGKREPIRAGERFEYSSHFGEVVKASRQRRKAAALADETLSIKRNQFKAPKVKLSDVGAALFVRGKTKTTKQSYGTEDMIYPGTYMERGKIKIRGSDTNKRIAKDELALQEAQVQAQRKINRSHRRGRILQGAREAHKVAVESGDAEQIQRAEEEFADALEKFNQSLIARTKALNNVTNVARRVTQRHAAPEQRFPYPPGVEVRGGDLLDGTEGEVLKFKRKGRKGKRVLKERVITPTMAQEAVDADLAREREARKKKNAEIRRKEDVGLANLNDPARMPIRDAEGGVVAFLGDSDTDIAKALEAMDTYVREHVKAVKKSLNSRLKYLKSQKAGAEAEAQSSWVDDDALEAESQNLSPEQWKKFHKQARPLYHDLDKVQSKVDKAKAEKAEFEQQLANLKRARGHVPPREIKNLKAKIKRREKNIKAGEADAAEIQGVLEQHPVVRELMGRVRAKRLAGVRKKYGAQISELESQYRPQVQEAQRQMMGLFFNQEDARKHGIRTDKTANADLAKLRNPVQLFRDLASRLQTGQLDVSTNPSSDRRHLNLGKYSDVRNRLFGGERQASIDEMDKADQVKQVAAAERAAAKVAKSGSGGGGEPPADSGGSFKSCCDRIVRKLTQIHQALRTGIKVSETKGSSSRLSRRRRNVTDTEETPKPRRRTTPKKDEAKKDEKAAAAPKEKKERQPLAFDEKTRVDIKKSMEKAGVITRGTDSSGQVVSNWDNEQKAIETTAAAVRQRVLSLKEAVKLLRGEWRDAGRDGEDTLEGELRGLLARQHVAERSQAAVAAADEKKKRKEDRDRRKKDQEDKKSARLRGKAQKDVLARQALDRWEKSVGDETMQEVAALRQLVQAGGSAVDIAQQQIRVYERLQQVLGQVSDQKAAFRALNASAGAPGGVDVESGVREAASAGKGKTVAMTGALESEMSGLGTAAAQTTGGAFNRAFFGGHGFFSRVLASTGTFIVRNFTAGFVFGITNALQRVMKEAIATESTFVRVGQALDSTGRKVGGLRTDLQTVSAQYGVSLQETYETATGLVGLFKSPEDIAGATKVVEELNLISLGALNAQEAMGALGSISSSFNDIDSNTRGLDYSTVEGLTHVADAFVAISDNLGVNIEVAIEGVGRMAGLAQQIGLSFEQTAVFVSQIAKRTNQTGAAAGEQFQRIIGALQTARGRAVVRRAFQQGDAESKQIGQDISAALDAREYGQALELIIGKYDELNKSQKNMIISSLGGQRQAAAITALFKDGAVTLNTLREAEEAHGRAELRATAISAEFAAVIQRLSTNFVNLGSNLIRSGIFDGVKVLLGLLLKVSEAINTVLSRFNDLADQNSFVAMLKSVALGVVGIWGAWKIGGRFINGIKGALNQVRGAMAALQVQAAATAVTGGGGAAGAGAAAAGASAASAKREALRAKSDAAIMATYGAMAPSERKGNFFARRAQGLQGARDAMVRQQVAAQARVAAIAAKRDPLAIFNKSGKTLTAANKMAATGAKALGHAFNGLSIAAMQLSKHMFLAVAGIAIAAVSIAAAVAEMNRRNEIKQKVSDAYTAKWGDAESSNEKVKESETELERIVSDIQGSMDGVAGAFSAFGEGILALKDHIAGTLGMLNPSFDNIGDWVKGIRDLIPAWGPLSGLSTQDESAAARAGVVNNDQTITVDGEEVSLNSWQNDQMKHRFSEMRKLREEADRRGGFSGEEDIESIKGNLQDRLEELSEEAAAIKSSAELTDEQKAMLLQNLEVQQEALIDIAANWTAQARGVAAADRLSMDQIRQIGKIAPILQNMNTILPAVAEYYEMMIADLGLESDSEVLKKLNALKNGGMDKVGRTALARDILDVEIANAQARLEALNPGGGEITDAEQYEETQEDLASSLQQRYSIIEEHLNAIEEMANLYAAGYARSGNFGAAAQAYQNAIEQLEAEMERDLKDAQQAQQDTADSASNLQQQSDGAQVQQSSNVSSNTQIASANAEMPEPEPEPEPSPVQPPAIHETPQAPEPSPSPSPEPASEAPDNAANWSVMDLPQHQRVFEPEPLLDKDGDGLPDYLDKDAGSGSNASPSGVVSPQSDGAVVQPQGDGAVVDSESAEKRAEDEARRARLIDARNEMLTQEANFGLNLQRTRIRNSVEGGKLDVEMAENALRIQKENNGSQQAILEAEKQLQDARNAYSDALEAYGQAVFQTESARFTRLGKDVQAAATNIEATKQAYEYAVEQYGEASAEAEAALTQYEDAQEAYVQAIIETAKSVASSRATLFGDKGLYGRAAGVYDKAIAKLKEQAARPDISNKKRLEYLTQVVELEKQKTELLKRGIESEYVIRRAQTRESVAAAALELQRAEDMLALIRKRFAEGGATAEEVKQAEAEVVSAATAKRDALEGRKQSGFQLIAARYTRLGKNIKAASVNLDAAAQAYYYAVQEYGKGSTEANSALQAMEDAQEAHVQAVLETARSLASSNASLLGDKGKYGQAAAAYDSAIAKLQAQAARGDISASKRVDLQVQIADLEKQKTEQLKRGLDAEYTVRRASTRESLELANLEVEHAQKVLALLKKRFAEGGATAEEVAQAQADVIQAGYAKQDALWAISQAGAEVVRARVARSGNPVKDAEQALKQARADLQHALEVYGKGSAEAKSARAGQINAETALRDAKLQAQLDTIDFNQSMGRMTANSAIEALREILRTQDLTKQQRRDLLLKIRGLQGDLREALTGSGFNISEIKMPTPYEVRRSLGVEPYIKTVKSEVDELRKSLKKGKRGIAQGKVEEESEALKGGRFLGRDRSEYGAYIPNVLNGWSVPLDYQDKDKDKIDDRFQPGPGKPDVRDSGYGDPSKEGAIGGRSDMGSVVRALEQVKAAIDRNGATVNNNVTMNNTFARNEMVEQVAKRVVELLNRNSGNRARANSSTPKMVSWHR